MSEDIKTEIENVKMLRRLIRPTDRTKIFVPTEEKIKKLIDMYMNEYLWESDEHRNEETLGNLLCGYMGGFRNTLMYETGDFESITIFQKIIPGWKSGFTFKLIRPENWGPSMVKEGKKLIHEIMDIFKLKRLSVESPDPRAVRMAKMVGFKVEGSKKMSYSWNGQLYDTIILGFVKEN